MNLSPAVLFVAVLIGVVFSAVSVIRSAKVKGWFGEKIVSVFHLRMRLRSDLYYVFDDLYMPKRSGGVTQIDHVVLSPFGVFVIETKNYSGRIYGSEDNRTWTATYGPKNRYKFQNPVHQNRSHTNAVKTFLQLDDAQVYSYVYFTGKARFATRLPRNVLRHGLTRKIKQHKTRVLDAPTLEACTKLLATQQIPAYKQSAKKQHRRQHTY